MNSKLLFIFPLTLLISCSYSRKEKIVNKKFKENDTTVVLTTEFVLKQIMDITEVVHDKKDGKWIFYHESFFDKNPGFTILSTLRQVIKIDSSVTELANMERGFTAYRKSKQYQWIIQKQK